MILTYLVVFGFFFTGLIIIPVLYWYFCDRDKWYDAIPRDEEPTENMNSWSGIDT